MRILLATSLVLLLAVFETLAWILPPVATRHRSSTSYIQTPTFERHKALFAIQEEKSDLNLILIDHYDSFTYNLADLLSQLCTTPPLVLAADCADSWEDLLLQSKEYRNWTDIDGVVLSPGPGNPQEEGKLSRDVIRKNPDLPILGVCLGHQILGDFYGAHVGLAPVPVHGQVRDVELVSGGSDDPVWKDIVDPIEVTRYHSLHVTDLTEDLIPTAQTTEEGLIMAMRHREYPHFGLQFHPESIGTPRGKQLLSNFLDVVNQRKPDVKLPPMSNAYEVKSGTTIQSQKEKENSREVFIHKIPSSTRIRPEDLMRDVLNDSDFSFWLDGDVPERRTSAPAISILGSSSKRIEYWGKEKPKHQQGLYCWEEGENSSCQHFPDEDVLTYLQDQYSALSVEATIVSVDRDGALVLERQVEDDLHKSLPFSFRGGHVGFLGYEVRHDTARFLENQEGGHHQQAIDANTYQSDAQVPTAAFLCADRSFVFDQLSDDWYIVAVASSEKPGSKEHALKWIEDSTKNLVNWKPSVDRVQHLPVNGKLHHEERDGSTTHASPTFQPNQSRATYNNSFNQCIEAIYQGNSYELCLTNQFEANVRAPGSTPGDLYRILRQRNPAPHSAFMNWNSAKHASSETDAAFAICCSSPERFVSVGRKNANAVNFSKNFELEVEAKPIKGTCARVQPQNGVSRTELEWAEDEARAKNLQASVKDRAENLMIVDLLRNDLSRVCTPGTVHVAKLMDIESFATVHQMVSTIRGRLDPTQASALDILKACFPGGSMTGAPKLRTMEILDDIEERVCRGPYSGSLGYISWNGSMDMNIIIRSAVLTPGEEDDWKVSIGAGGAITALSEKRDEYDEMVLKSSAVVKAVQEWSATSYKTGASEASTKELSEKVLE